MSYFEFTFVGELTPIFEEKTQFLLSKINDGAFNYKLEKYYDDEISEEKKRRTLIITSPVNNWDYLFQVMKDVNVQYIGYFKQRII